MEKSMTISKHVFNGRLSIIELGKTQKAYKQHSQIGSPKANPKQGFVAIYHLGSAPMRRRGKN